MGRGGSDETARLHDLLRAAGASLATAESLTGGRLAALLTAVSGSSQTFVGGLVTYATSLKVELLGVPAELVDEHGVVSAQCAAAMAEGARRLTGAEWALSTTGVAGPGPSQGLPAGTVHVGIAGPGHASTLALELPGDREAVRERTCREAVSALCDVLAREETPLG